jgi:hypothetical protein
MFQEQSRIFEAGELSWLGFRGTHKPRWSGHRGLGWAAATLEGQEDKQTRFPCAHPLLDDLPGQHRSPLAIGSG